jgi:CubicO group peptidase (beta-lactamase class C family)
VPPRSTCDSRPILTVDDLLAFARMLLRGGAPVLSADAVTAMISDQLTPEQRASDGRGFLDGNGWGFCQSVITEGARAGAFGWDGGFGSSWLVDPTWDLTMIVLTQRLSESAETTMVHTDLQAAAYAAVAEH